jgi:hypothetical protein
MIKEHINIVNSRTWVNCNLDSKSANNRINFVSEHGGEFVKIGRSWKWQNIHTQEKTKYELTDADGNVTIVENLAKFCRDNDLNKSAVHKVIKGDRNQHKGFTCKKI